MVRKTANELQAVAEERFGKVMHSVLSPSQTIQHPSNLRGRQEQLDTIKKALLPVGRHVFVFGHRGVGKSSLAQTAAFQQQSSDAKPIFVQCSPGATCLEVVKEIALEALPTDPRIIRSTFAKSTSASIKGFGVEQREQIERGTIPVPTSLNQAARLLELVCQWHSKRPIVVIDEFDQVSAPDQQVQFANLAKMIGDRHIPVAIIFCGIGSSLDDLFSAHPSAHRHFHPVPLERLGWTPRIEIIESAADTLSISVDDTTKYRIAHVSDGFPHYIHLICEKMFWRVFNADNGLRVTPDLFEDAIEDASAAMEPELRKPYELATKKYTNDCEPILWAVADSDNFQRQSREIYKSYERIMGDLKQEPLERAAFNARMNLLKKPARGSILTGNRQGWYEFTEKMLRGYARLRALRETVLLEREHPLQPKRYGGLLGHLSETGGSEP